MTPTEVLLQIQAEAEQRATVVSRSSPDHGPRHWRDVARIGLRLCDALEFSHSDRALVFTFAALHDTQRQNEYHDPIHGSRAAGVLEDIAENVELPFSDAQTALLTQTLVYHDAGGRTYTPPMGACFDADRLTIGRVGIEPDLKYMSTDPVRAAFERWCGMAADVMLTANDPSWEEIARGYTNAD